MLRLKQVIMSVLVVTCLALTYFILLVCIAYISTDGISFKMNGVEIGYDGLTYGNLKGFEIPSNSVFIAVDDEQQDITKCEYDDGADIRSLTVVLSGLNSVTDFSVFGVSIGDTIDEVTDNLPKETETSIDNDSGIRVSKYVDKNDNVLIVGSDIELNVVTYITIRDISYLHK